MSVDAYLVRSIRMAGRLYPEAAEQPPDDPFQRRGVGQCLPTIRESKAARDHETPPQNGSIYYYTCNSI